MFKILKSISFQQYSQKLSASLVYAILSSVALNFFIQPAHLYSSGVTGVALILTTISVRLFGEPVPTSVLLFALNIPLFIVAWRQIGKQFTIFTIITVALASVMLQIMPVKTLTTDPVMSAIFGGAIIGAGIGYALRMGISSGGVDIISLAVRKKTGHSVGAVSLTFNSVIVCVAGILFGWQSALYTIVTIFFSAKVTDAMFTQQKRMQVLVVTQRPSEIIQCVQEEMRRGITIIHGAEGAYKRQVQTMLFIVVTAFELPEFSQMIKRVDPNAFVSISENVRILGNFTEEEM